MEINELRDGQVKVNVLGMITETHEPRTVNLRAGGEARVADFQLMDASGQIKLVLWDEQADDIKKGDRLKILNGYVTSFRGELALSVGRYGKLEKVV